MSPSTNDAADHEDDPTSPSLKNQGMGPASTIEFEPPLACVRRILRKSLPSSTNVGKDASTAFARACGIFVLYLTACANDFCRENRRQTITANDVLAAVTELDFDEFIPQLKTFLERYRAEEKTKKEKKKSLSSLNSANPKEDEQVTAMVADGKDDEDDEAVDVQMEDKQQEEENASTTSTKS
mmetsp:Transcript_1792/g.2479  ORF Transcript_1792/g.2479 Transcript_1792/m.2479 type:complete len:183 (-) Transcript_1792:84-632(-)